MACINILKELLPYFWKSTQICQVLRLWKICLYMVRRDILEQESTEDVIHTEHILFSPWCPKASCQHALTHRKQKTPKSILKYQELFDQCSCTTQKLLWWGKLQQNALFPHTHTPRPLLSVVLFWHSWLARINSLMKFSWTGELKELIHRVSNLDNSYRTRRNLLPRYSATFPFQKNL